MSASKATTNGTTSTPTTTIAQSSVHLPRIAIKFCTQCKWNLRAAYYAQELLQTFSITLGEVALIPSSGGVFTITLFTASPLQSPPSLSSTEPSNTEISIQETQIWDRKTESGFPETKELKSRVRNVIEPERDLGHVDRSLKKAGMKAEMESEKGVEEGGMAEVAAGPESSSVAWTAGEANANGKADETATSRSGDAIAATQNQDSTARISFQNANEQSTSSSRAITTAISDENQECQDCA